MKRWACVMALLAAYSAQTFFTCIGLGHTFGTGAEIACIPFTTFGGVLIVFAGGSWAAS